MMVKKLLLIVVFLFTVLPYLTVVTSVHPKYSFLYIFGVRAFREASQARRISF